MKKELTILMLLLFLLPLVSAVNLNLKSSFQPGETLLGTLEGNFLFQLNQENFYFYSDREQIPLIFDVAKIQNKYYFYALLPAEERNYTLLIKNVKYFENAKEMTGNFEKNFTVLGNVSDFSVYPGFLIIRNESFLTLESLNQPLIVSAKFLNSSQSVQVPIADKKKVYFSASEKNFTLTEIELSSPATKYLIPAAIISSAVSSEYESNVAETEKFRFNKEEYNFSVYEKNKTFFSIYLQNLGDKIIKNITLTYSDTLEGTIELSPDEISELKESESQKITLLIDAKIYKIFKGKISASAENYSAESLLIINAIEQGKPLPIEDKIPPVTGKESCTDLQGELCLDTQECSETSKDTIEGLCCISGTCQEKTSYWGIIIGIILLIAVGIGLYFLYQRSKKAKISSEDILKKQEKKFEERNLEVRGNLSRS